MPLGIRATDPAAARRRLAPNTPSVRSFARLQLRVPSPAWEPASYTTFDEEWNMRTASPSRLMLRFIAILVPVGVLVFAISSMRAQSPTVTPRAGWRVGGTVAAVGRLGNTLFIGGSFRGIAPEANAAGGLLLVGAQSGSLAARFPGLVGNVNAVEPDGTGGWFVGGNFLDAVSDGTVHVRFRLAHVLASGDLDPAWTPRADGGQVRALRFVPGVGLFVGGDFTSLNGTTRGLVGLLDPVTGLVLPWTYTLAGGGNSVRTLAADGGTLFIGGNFATADGLARANLVAVSATASGQIGPDLQVGGQVEAITPAASGTLYVGGSFATLKGAPRQRLGRVTHGAGELDVALDAWNPGADATVRAFAPSGGSVFVGGDFFNIGGEERGCIAQLDASTGVPMAFAPNGSNPVSGLTIAGETLYVVGPSSFIADSLRNGAAAFNVGTGALLPWNPSPAGTAFGVASQGAQVALAGAFTGHGAVWADNIAALDLQTGAIKPWIVDANGSVDEMALHGSTVYIGGQFTEVNDEPRSGLAAVDAVTGQLLPWNPSPNSNITALTLDATSAYIGGGFSTVGGVARNRLARVRLSDGSVDPTFAPEIASSSGAPNDIVIAGTTLYAGGGAITVGTAPAARLIALDAATGARISSFSANASSTINRLDVAGGFVYAAGGFTLANGQPRTGMAKYDGTTGAVQPWAPLLGFDAASTAAGSTVAGGDVSVQGTEALISGAFATVGGLVRLGVARVDTTTGAPTSWEPNLGAPPTGGFGTIILPGADVTIIGGGRLQLSDNLLNGLSLWVEPSAQRPLPPTGFTGEVVGDQVTVRWQPSPMGLPATAYILEAGSGRGLANLATLNVGLALSFSAPGIPAGTYYLRVRAVTPLGTSAPTDDLVLTVGGGAGCTSPPAPPLGPLVEVDGSTISMLWFPTTGSVPSSYVLQAGSGHGLSNLANLDVGNVQTLVVPGVPPGIYFIRVAARNACGMGIGPDVLVNVGNVPAPPGAPLGLTGTAVNGNVTLTWTAPGGTVTSYQLEAGSAAGSTNIAAIAVGGTSFAVGGVPPGVYFLRVRAVNAVGVSPPSNEFVLVVQ